MSTWVGRGVTPLFPPARKVVPPHVPPAAHVSQARDGAQPRELDTVARLHLGNGARNERLNWMGDISAKSLKQSSGTMVNYLYDRQRLDRQRARLAEGAMAGLPAMEELRFGS